MAEAEDHSFCVSSLFDYIPIIGTVESTVETVVALCEEDYKQAEEKGISASSGSITDSVPGGLVIKGIGREGVNVLGKAVAKKGAESFAKRAAAKAEPRAVVTTLEGLPFNKKDRQPGPETKEKQEKKRPKRGEHVINNNVLRVYKDIREKFCDSVLHRRPENLGHPEPFSPDVRDDIGDKMKVYFEENEAYVDANAIIYGRNIARLRNAIIVYMQMIYHKDLQKIGNVERTIEQEVQEFITRHYYIDEHALAKWLRGGDENREKFERAKREVENMFNNLTYRRGGDMVIQWVHELTRN